MSTDNEYRRRRESTVYNVLTFIGVGAFVGFIVLISKGLLLYLMIGVFAIGGIGYLHYLLWGADLNAETAYEREVLEEQEQKEIGSHR